MQLLIGPLLGPSSPCRPLTDYTQGALEALPLQTTPELGAVTAALAPLRIQKGQVGIERALPCPEDIRTLAATDLANEFTAVSCSTDDLLEWHCVSDERHDGGIRLLAPEIPFILQPFRASEQFWIDRRRTDCGADHPHGTAYRVEEGRACVLHQVPTVGDLDGIGQRLCRSLTVDDADVMHLLKVMLKASGKKGVPQGGVISPLLSNLYLNEVDKMLERAREVTRNGKYTYIEYARFADDLVILIDAYKRHDWLVGAVDKRLREEFGKLQVEINDEKSRTVDLERGECFGFLGFEFRYLRGLSGAMRPHYTPKLKKRTALVRALKEVFRRHRSQPIERVINLINPMLRGWVNYFAVGHSSECFSFIKDWVEKKVRRHLAHAQKRRGFDWERWNRRWLYDTLGLFNAYRVRRDGPKVAPAG